MDTQWECQTRERSGTHSVSKKSSLKMFKSDHTIVKKLVRGWSNKRLVDSFEGNVNYINIMVHDLVAVSRGSIYEVRFITDIIRKELLKRLKRRKK